MFIFRKKFLPRGDFDVVYPSEAGWKSFVEFWRKQRWEPECHNKEEVLQALNGDEEIAIALFAVFGQHTLDNIYRDGVKDLGYLSPKECLENDLRGRLQSFLKTFPYI
jgi:hypothetical protein